ncbi:hypothetical protein GGX14DRAFT_644827 [Mycena pura]|uniref:Uncharacterized protein n=1 Tax=Mycena pura TaxID=153505 RepID=A0AAD6VC26_9AGAR|nr:hypothetical protein GGX14DRAFT_644827 [Mycena pura]
MSKLPRQTYLRQWKRHCLLALRTTGIGAADEAIMAARTAYKSTHHLYFPHRYTEPNYSAEVKVDVAYASIDIELTSKSQITGSRKSIRVRPYCAVYGRTLSTVTPVSVQADCTVRVREAVQPYPYAVLRIPTGHSRPRPPCKVHDVWRILTGSGGHLKLSHSRLHV